MDDQPDFSARGPRCRVSLDSWITNADVLTTVALRARKTRGAFTYGLDGVVGAFLCPEDCRELAVRLAADQRWRSYRPTPLRSIYRRSDGRSRELRVASFRDRVLQMALRHGMQPFVGAQFTPATYGVRGAGGLVAVEEAAAALVAALHITHAGAVHLVTTDVHAFYDSVPHTALRELFRKSFAGRLTRRLLDAILRQGERRYGYGLAQGGPLSPLLANWLLTHVDRFFDARRPVFFGRYVDDVVMVVPGDLDRARANLHELELRLHRLGLRLN